MITQTQYYITQNTLPYRNLALEEYLLKTVPVGTCVLYLWQNRCTVVAGRNQNAWQECRIAELEADGGYFARRLSGGGAVFHDLGNLNFTFLVREEDYNVSRQLDVVLGAVKAFDIQAEKSGRNDITVQGRKFSGNAFYRSGGSCYHHGTLLVNVNMQDLSRYLNVSAAKLSSKGVSSVKSRVANLIDFCPELTIKQLQHSLINSFAKTYGCTPSCIADDKIDWQRVEQLTEKFSSWEWKFGHRLEFQYELTHRFVWGDIQLQLSLDRGRVLQAAVYSDAMDAWLISQIPQQVRGCLFSSKVLAASLNPLLQDTKGEQEKQIIYDLQDLIHKQEF